MKTIKQTYTIEAPVEKVWQALVDPKVIEKWGGGPAEMGANQGENFSLWGGQIEGKNVKVVANKELVQEWYAGNWPEPSILKFELKEKDGKTTVELLHTNVPDKEAKGIEDGWRQYYLGPLKELVES